MPVLEGAEAPSSTSSQILTDRISAARAAQRTWREIPLRQRLRTVRNVRSSLAESALDLCSLFPTNLVRTPADSLTAEIIPLAEACKFLEKHALKVLAPSHPPTRLRPLWLRGVNLEIRREPLGVILVVGPANYPLFLPGVQAIQALVAGNAVVLKPGRGGAPLAEKFRALMIQAGIPGELFIVLDEAIKNVELAIDAGVDKILFTGSVAAGRIVYQLASAALIPTIMELSGEDAVFVLPGADLARAASAVRFGLSLNGGQTCIAPRRIFLWQQVAAPFRRQLEDVLRDALLSISVNIVRDEAEALSLAAASRYALGASVFGELSAAQDLASKINAGVVVVNDMIVPTADPRLPFGGRQNSGFGVTRGAEGLLELTAVKAIAVQRSKRLRHLESHPANAEQLFSAFLSATNTRGWTHRISAYRNLFRALARAQSKG